MPILVVYGSDDTIFPCAGWAELTSAMDNVTYVEIAGGEHGCGRRPDAVAAVVDFLDRVDG
jgi:pimeloyl-ACP methyl ester carboxylesterase